MPFLSQTDHELNYHKLTLKDIYFVVDKIKFAMPFCLRLTSQLW